MITEGILFAHRSKHHHYTYNSRNRLSKNHHVRLSCGYCPSNFLQKSMKWRRKNAQKRKEKRESDIDSHFSTFYHEVEQLKFKFNRFFFIQSNQITIIILLMRFKRVYIFLPKNRWILEDTKFWHILNYNPVPKKCSSYLFYWWTREHVSAGGGFHPNE